MMMKRYTQTDLRNLRHKPSQVFLQSMETFLAELPEQKETSESWMPSCMSKKTVFPGNSVTNPRSRLSVAILSAFALLLVTAGIKALLYKHVLTTDEIIIQGNNFKLTENASGSEKGMISSLDRIDIHADPELLWDSRTGILAEGDRIVKSGALPYKNAVYRMMYGQGKTCEGEIEYRTAWHGLVFRRKISMRLGGDYYSMDMPQKSLQIDTADGLIEYPLFESRSTDTYASILLRNSGNDCLFTRVADGVQSRLIDNLPGVNLLTLAWKPVSVYLNDQYWGIYNMRESVDVHTICRHEGISRDTAEDINILMLNGTPIHGSGESYRQLLAYIRQSDPAGREEDRNYLESQIDIDSYLDWLAVKIYFGDSDAASTFICYQVPGQKWKCLAQDFDYGLFQADYDAVTSYLKPSGMGPANADNDLFRKILKVDAYKERFIRKVGALYRTFTTEAMQRELDICVAMIEPEMENHLARWAPCNESTLNPDAPTDPAEAWQYWKKRVQRMREGTMVNRPQYVYEQIQNYFGLTSQEMEAYF